MKTFEHPTYELKEGSLVCFNREPTDLELDSWGNWWPSEMNRYIGLPLHVAAISGDKKTLYIKGTEYVFPACLAEVMG